MYEQHLAIEAPREDYLAAAYEAQAADTARNFPSPRFLPDLIDFRLATTDDIPSLVALGEQFFQQSQYGEFGIKFSPTALKQFLSAAIPAAACPYIVATVDDAVVGFVSFTLDGSYSDAPVAVMQQIYVAPEYRRSAIGRHLISFAESISRECGACAFFAPVNSGHNNTRSLINAFCKSGFVLSGHIMSKGTL